MATHICTYMNATTLCPHACVLLIFSPQHPRLYHDVPSPHAVCEPCHPLCAFFHRSNFNLPPLHYTHLFSIPDIRLKT